ncbi:hypothetical protein ACB092_06G057500 [Castanea dentata]
MDMANSGTHHQSDSKRKKVELSQDAVVSIDRISNLSDSLICHILSFLPTKEAVVTSILSNRWKTLWTLVPKINLENNRFQKIPLSLTHIVYRVLALHRAPLLRNFSLTSYSPCDPFHLDTWIHTVIGRKVQQLRLHFSHSKKLVKLPRTVFTCKTIVILELIDDIVLDPPSNFQFPSLKILCLCEIAYKSEDSFSNLLSGCPVLEDLRVKLREDLDGATNFKIIVPTLKLLGIEFIPGYPRPHDYKFEIYSPVLENFRFCGDLGNLVFIEKLTKVVDAEVGIYAGHWVLENGLHYGARIFKLVRELNCSKFLSICPGQKECLCFDSIYPSMYQNLVRLEFGVNLSNWHVLKALLLVAPNLKVLVLDKNDYDEEDNRLCCIGRLDGSGCLSLLTAFSFNGYEELEHEAEFVKYVLNEARLLNAMTIKIYDKNFKESLLQRLSMIPRQSTKCVITVE